MSEMRAPSKPVEPPPPPAPAVSVIPAPERSERVGSPARSLQVFDREWVNFSAAGLDRRVTDSRGDLDGGPHRFYAKTAAGENLLVASHVEIGEAVAEIDLFSVHLDGTERAPP